MAQLRIDQRLGNSDKISVSNCARLLGRHPRTVCRWFKWYEQFPVPDYISLPTRHGVNRHYTGYIWKHEFNMLKIFSENIKRGGPWYGCMSEYNAIYQWDKKLAKKILSNKGKTVQDILEKTK